jgi:hypothetical protein
MAGKVLKSDHAEDVGGVIVEPGGEIPDDADEDAVKALEAAGKIGDAPSSSSSSSAKKKGE